MHFLPINKHISILHVCSTKTPKIKHWSLMSPGKVASWIFPLQMKGMLLLQIKALCSPLPCLTVPCKCIKDVGWVLPQHLTAFERIKLFQYTQHHDYADLRGAFHLTTSKTTLQNTLPSVYPRLFCTIIFFVAGVSWLSLWKNTAQQAVYLHKINWFHICKWNQTSLLFLLIR